MRPAGAHPPPPRTWSSHAALRAGAAHLLAILFLATRLAYVRSSRVDRFKLTGVSWWLHLLQTLAAAACLLITLFLLNGRLATSRASLIPSARLRGVSPYEWVGEASPCTPTHQCSVCGISPATSGRVASMNAHLQWLT